MRKNRAQQAIMETKAIDMPPKKVVMALLLEDIVLSWIVIKLL